MIYVVLLPSVYFFCVSCQAHLVMLALHMLTRSYSYFWLSFLRGIQVQVIEIQTLTEAACY